jgi:hypothetical protein
MNAENVSKGAFARLDRFSGFMGQTLWMLPVTNKPRVTFGDSFSCSREVIFSTGEAKTALDVWLAAHKTLCPAGATHAMFDCTAMVTFHWSVEVTRQC